jgi:hypothetical protein
MDDIFTLAKETILNGGYDLVNKLRELTAIMIVGQISVDEYQVLTQLAYEHADSETTETNVLLALKTINSELAKINARLDALESANGETPVEEVYPEWERWNGHPDSGYKFGDKVSHLGVKYVSNYTGLNVWEPGVIGTEALWTKVE